MTDILVIRETSNGREGVLMRWGLIPPRAAAAGSKRLPSLINVKAETIASKPMFKSAIRRQRCIIPASGFYEWKLLADRKRKQPYYFSLKDSCPISFAGIWQRATMEGRTIESCAIITTESNDLVSPIHDRMPVMLSRDTIDAWLKPAQLPPDVLEFCMKPYDSGNMQSWPVSTAVNNARNQGERLSQTIR